MGFVDHPQWGQESNLLEILPPQDSQTVIRAEDFFLALAASLTGVFFLGAEGFFLAFSAMYCSRAFLGVGHVPHTGRSRAQELAPVSKLLGALVLRERHQTLKSRLNDEALKNM